jgi:hypothetical protein
MSKRINQNFLLDKQFVHIFKAFVKNYEKFHWLLLGCNNSYAIEVRELTQQAANGRCSRCRCLGPIPVAAQGKADIPG